MRWRAEIRILGGAVEHTGSREDLLPGVALAFFGIDTDLSAANLALQEVFLFAPEFLQFRFALGETILQFCLTFVEFGQFFLRVADHAWR